MFAAYLTVTLLASGVNGIAAVANLIGHEYPKTQADKLGVPRWWTLPLGTLLAVGALGLLVGFAVPALGTVAAAGLGISPRRVRCAPTGGLPSTRSLGHILLPGRGRLGREPGLPRALLGLRLSPDRSPATVAGWQIGERGEDWIRLEAASWFLTGTLLVETADGPVSLGIFLHYDRRFGHGVWPPLSPIHRRLAPGLLRDAAAWAAIDSLRAERTIS